MRQALIAHPLPPILLQRAKSLQRWNLVTAFIHLACAIAIFAATDQENTVPMVTVYANVT